ncbi:unnamed protein product, partial [Clonostachys rosea]
MASLAPLLTIIVFISVLLYHTRHSAPKYKITFRKRSQIPLVLHIISGAFEIIRFHALSTIRPPIPTGLDLFASLVQSLTTLQLVKTLTRGDVTTRPTYQVAGMVRPPLSLLAFALGDAQLHRGSVKLVNGFIYVRIIIYISRLLQLQRVFNGSATYAYAVFLGGIVAVYESKLPGGIPIYLGLVGLCISTNRSVTEYVAKKSLSKRSRYSRDKEKDNYITWANERLNQALLFLGLAELETIREYYRPPELNGL